ncbi:MAG: phosphoribosylformylglycinamidine synthase I [Omnitrophica WOR_2 bacterium GWF2_43_52]|nr:MAG: phosphoribosylformylglycinamidine synthase I [Omnitrophica WOR_2 bacterium GWA2_44_7]OGX14206.1 MAG: phosphoribosylformylglycinamidine synthase I [Omnitrophica WOR_2 bacterium GWC2_44_8]OGX22731.1 MAG: phosphoribosylformylglycinamidine synthase I [Omnitrophica WOR_2 bacterium GWF2_43_52]OGX57627.1 MAG: phosphoribosylformylglycinamidine synthase I [Omnitrophica WOR_2 bacterium RIFOXYC2_FULL_43_9]HAH20251.1 phosphoribosylformylglycinamidine synthase I [Candidatus Omnitrophota bacterium]
MKPRALVLRTAGTNCDKETAFAFSEAGAECAFVHINELKNKTQRLSEYHILVLSGGFSYGDDIAAGKILANELKYALGNELKAFIKSGKLIIGICNGFQILAKAGLLPGNDTLEQEVTLTINDSAKFEDRWVYVRGMRDEGRETKCVWTKGLPEVVYLPVAHGEGKFMSKDKALLQQLESNGQIVLRYCDEKGETAGYPANPNGSENDIAGICDITGRIFGLMPHPERHSFGWQHPRWTREGLRKTGDGLQIFRNGVEYAKKYL